jgi:two-component system alkaline phosphatase synthesis response regulator PhoP
MPGKILIIDDEPDMLALLQEALEQRGHQVFTAGSGIHGLNQARRRLPDVVLLDVLLGDMDGYSVCEILRSQPSTARTPVILMTALAGEMARLHGFESGAIDYVAKPVRPRDVIQRIEAVLAATCPSEPPNHDASEQGHAGPS